MDEERICGWDGRTFGLCFVIHIVQHTLHDFMMAGRLVVTLVQELLAFLPVCDEDELDL